MPYTPLTVNPLTVWLQNVLPLVYDDSLSYLEFLGKVSAKLNELIAANAAQDQALVQFLQSFEGDLSTTVTSYLNTWKLDGTLQAILTASLEEFNDALDLFKTETNAAIAEFSGLPEAMTALQAATAASLSGFSEDLEDFQTTLDTLETSLMYETIYLKPTVMGDDTALINAALLDYTTVVLTEGTYYINAVAGVKLWSLDNRHLIFHPNAKMQVIANDATNYSCISIFESKNITIDDPTIIGDRDTHIGTTGEWGHGIDVLNSDNIIINNPKCSKLWGDGIYVGVSYLGGTLQTGRVFINNPIIDLCRRNGIAVCSGKYVEINSGLITNIDGTFPKSGIDIEAEGGSYVQPILEKVIVNNLVTKNCYAGITLLFDALSGRSLRTDVTIDNHMDEGSALGLLYHPTTGIVGGTININNSNYINNGSDGINLLYPTVNAPKIVIDKAIIRNCNQMSLSADEDSAGINVFGRTTDTTINAAMGNVDIVNPIVIDTNATPKMRRAIHIRNRNTTNGTIQNLKVLDPIQIEYGTNTYNFQLVFDGVRVTDRFEQMKCSMAYFELEATGNSFFKSFTNIGMTSPILYKLKADYPQNVEVTFTVDASYLLTIQPENNQNILPLSTVNGKTLSTSTKGNSITLKRIGTSWIITNMIGTWTVQP